MRVSWPGQSGSTTRPSCVTAPDGGYRMGSLKGKSCVVEKGPRWTASPADDLAATIAIRSWLYGNQVIVTDEGFGLVRRQCLRWLIWRMDCRSLAITDQPQYLDSQGRGLS
ncbi:hypothetical protein Micbo1qcDRAFT_53249 [Microdochium bolleyi]|uniref:Uncharacterized protein n=1 Tax=Microdochium bolleyi TaxID=196109 RepID=A0A136J7G4_9PEZI|nr:hypothetical protein Micbo1qcDRAFT_53249 [Microdochium bolleyi]